MIYTADHAEMLKEDAGRKWRPSNGTDFDLFSAAMCHNCQGKDSCMIVPLTKAFNVDDEDYPEDWVINDAGQPTCTAFEEDKLSA